MTRLTRSDNWERDAQGEGGRSSGPWGAGAGDKGGWIHPPQQQAPFEGLGSARVRRKRTWTPPFATPTPRPETRANVLPLMQAGPYPTSQHPGTDRAVSCPARQAQLRNVHRNGCPSPGASLPTAKPQGPETPHTSVPWKPDCKMPTPPRGAGPMPTGHHSA